MYDIMKHHFNYHDYPGINYSIASDVDDLKRETFYVELIQDIDEAFHSFQVKFSAAYARLRIEHKAIGVSTREQLENILPEKVRKNEDIAAEMPQTARINLSKISKRAFFDRLKSLGFSASENTFSGLNDEELEYLRLM